MTAPIFARITGTGSYLPGEPISNEALIAAHGLDTSDDWIVERTGIRARHLAAAGVAASDLALEASRRALDAAGRQPNDIDLVIVATSTPDYVFPSTAALLQAKLGIGNGGAAFDLQAVCSGFVYALSVAEKFIRSGSHRCALVVGAEVFSRILDWRDRGTCVLFGDGAGAVVLEASDRPGILASALHADGSHHGILAVPGHLHGGQPVGDLDSTGAGRRRTLRESQPWRHGSDRRCRLRLHLGRRVDQLGWRCSPTWGLVCSL